MRNHLLGARVVLADGSRPKSGGQLVKNVTGYDLHKLYCGSHGSLCLLLEASLRLFPAPDEQRVLALACEALEPALELASEVLALPCKPLAVVVHDLGEAPGWELAVVLAGHAARVAWEVEEVSRALPQASVRAGEEARGARARLRELEFRAGRWPDCVVQVKPSDVGELARRLEAEGFAGHASWHPGIGQCALWFAELDAARSASWSARMADLPHRASWPGAAPEALGELDRFGAPGPGLPLMKNLQRALDPNAVFARGRFHGGL